MTEEQKSPEEAQETTSTVATVESDDAKEPPAGEAESSEASNEDVSSEQEEAENSHEVSSETEEGKSEKNTAGDDSTDDESMSKVALLVPNAHKKEAAVDAEKPYAQPQTVGAKAQNLRQEAPQQAQQRSLPIPLQSLAPYRRTGSLFTALKQPWFKRIQEKTIFQNISRPPKIHPNSLLVACLSAIVIALQGYLNLSLPNLSVDALNNIMSQFGASEPQLFLSLPVTYNFQLPLALLAGAVLGSFLGAFSVFVFIAIGLFSTPIFANGGGLDYLYQPGFPFLVAMFVGAIFSGYFTRLAFSPQKSGKQVLFLYGGGIISALITHGVALIGLTLLLAVTSPFLAPAHPFSSWWQWVVHLSLEPLPYDLMATCLFLWFTRYIRLSVYPALY